MSETSEDREARIGLWILFGIAVLAFLGFVAFMLAGPLPQSPPNPTFMHIPF